MTGKEAIEWLIPPTNCSNGDENDPIRKHWIAYNMAVEALEQEPKTGHWIVFDDRYNKCSECGFHYDTWNNRTEGLPIMFNFCPNCGAKMVEPQESEGA